MLAILAAFTLSSSLVAVPERRPFSSLQDEVWEYRNLKLGLAADQVILSWNVIHGENAAVRFEIRGHRESEGGWLPVAKWTLDDRRAERTSVQCIAAGEDRVDTDTLLLKKPTSVFDVRVIGRRLGEGPVPELRLLTIAGSVGKPVPPFAPTPFDRAAFRTIEVPQRAQGDYPNGGVLCSPTSLSMVLNHWGGILDRPELGVDMPEVQSRVYDEAYGGTGNWPFNAAYAGSFDGIRSYVARFRDMNDLEKWIASGIPVICSVSLDLLKGLEKDSGSGHLVVLLGFDTNGDPIFNDPAWRGEVRRTYRRSDFERAWAYSRHTVYVALPEGIAPPKGGEGRWIE